MVKKAQVQRTNWSTAVNSVVLVEAPVVGSACFRAVRHIAREHLVVLLVAWAFFVVCALMLALLFLPCFLLRFDVFFLAV